MLTVHDYSYTYENGTEALKNVDFNVSSEEFVLLAGPNGGGKSTILKSILGIIPRYSGGRADGVILFEGNPVVDYAITGLAGKIGIVLQDPESQISNLTVWEEVTFALGNLLYQKDVILHRAADALTHMDLTDLKNQQVHELSGGQLQRLSISTLIALKPSIIIFDEPLANLDPLGVESVVNALVKIKEFVDIIIIASHWLDPFLDLATRFLVIDSGKLVLDVDSAILGAHIDKLAAHRIEVPHRYRINDVLHKQGVEVETRKGVIDLPASTSLQPLPTENLPEGKTAIELDQVTYTYVNGITALEEVNVDLEEGSRTAVIGRNGSGKTTLARLLAGIRKPSSGDVVRHTTCVGMMLQKPSLGFITSSVQDEMLYGTNLEESEVVPLLDYFDLLEYRDKSPFELSEGEQRRLALALAISNKQELVILDEPTAGMDARYVQFVLEVMADYKGIAIFITHDSRLLGEFVKRVIVLKRGRVDFHDSVRQLSRLHMEHLGYQAVNATVALAIRYLNTRIPMLPEQLKVCNADCL